jgi:hypothetical protein
MTGDNKEIPKSGIAYETGRDWARLSETERNPGQPGAMGFEAEKI